MKLFEILEQLISLPSLKMIREKKYGHEGANGACLPCRLPTRRRDDNTPEPWSKNRVKRGSCFSFEQRFLTSTQAQ